MKRQLLWVFTFFLLSSFIAAPIAQKNNTNAFALFTGKVTDIKKEMFDDYEITVYKGKKVIFYMQVMDEPDYRFKIPLGEVYSVEYSKDGYAQKTVEIDLKNLPDDQTYLPISINISLYEGGCSAIEKALKKPVGRATYNLDAQGLAWDMVYTRERMVEVKTAMKKCK